MGKSLMIVKPIKPPSQSTGKEIAVYNPEKGLMTIAAAREGERIAKRARDQEGLRKASEIKLRAQADYIVWRDGVVVPSRKTGSSGVKGRSRVNQSKSHLPAGDPGDVIAFKWRKKLCSKVNGITKLDADKLRASVTENALRAVRAHEFESKGTERGTAGTGEFERYTPAQHIELAREVMGNIDVDPASNPKAQKTVGAGIYFTQKDDGLKRDWVGNVWLNPPYHRDLQPAFIDKLIEEVKAGRTKQAVLLTNNSTDTEWFHRAAEASDVICFTTGRVGFTTPDGEILAPTQGQTFFYYGSSHAKFAEVFGRVGWIARFGK